MIHSSIHSEPCHKERFIPITTIDNTLEGLTVAKWYVSSLDLKSGYWLVEMHPRPREKTAFTAARGL
jgi:hypothetical protein